MSPWLWRGRLAGGCLAGGRVPSSLSYFPSLVSFALHEMHISTQCYVRPSPCCAMIGSHSEVQRVLTLLGTLLYEARLGQVHYVKEVFKRWQFVSNSPFARNLQVGYDLAEKSALWESLENSRCIMRWCGVAATLKYNCCTRRNVLHWVIPLPTYPRNLPPPEKRFRLYQKPSRNIAVWRKCTYNLSALLSYLCCVTLLSLRICLSGIQCYPDICTSSSITIKLWSISWMVRVSQILSLMMPIGFLTCSPSARVLLLI